MRKISLDQAKPGIKVSKTIYSLEGVLLLSEGAKLTESNMKKLRNNGVNEIFVEELIHDTVFIPEVERNKVLTDAKTQIKEIMTSPMLKGGIDSKRIVALVEKLLMEILDSDEIVKHLFDIRSIDDYTFSHCVNVSIYSMIVGIGMNMKGNTVKELGTGAILHDVGKMLVQQDILQKPGGLTVNEFAEVKKHTLFGYELLYKIDHIGTVASSIAIAHHERIDGSGYPNGLKGDEIPLFARIVAVSDVFDALTSNRVYRKLEPPHKALDFITMEAGKHFDPDVVTVFVNQMAYYSIGTAVILSTGEKGLVTNNNVRFPHKPVVRVLINAAGESLHPHHIIDLHKTQDVRIASMWIL